MADGVHAVLLSKGIDAGTCSFKCLWKKRKTKTSKWDHTQVEEIDWFCKAPLFQEMVFAFMMVGHLPL